jgi:hypothetical protein
MNMLPFRGYSNKLRTCHPWIWRRIGLSAPTGDCGDLCLSRRLPLIVTLQGYFPWHRQVCPPQVDIVLCLPSRELRASFLFPENRRPSRSYRSLRERRNLRERYNHALEGDPPFPFNT